MMTLSKTTTDGHWRHLCYYTGDRSKDHEGISGQQFDSRISLQAWPLPRSSSKPGSQVCAGRRSAAFAPVCRKLASTYAGDLKLLCSLMHQSPSLMIMIILTSTFGSEDLVAARNSSDPRSPKPWYARSGHSLQSMRVNRPHTRDCSAEGNQVRASQRTQSAQDLEGTRDLLVALNGKGPRTPRPRHARNGTGVSRHSQEFSRERSVEDIHVRASHCTQSPPPIVREAVRLSAHEESRFMHDVHTHVQFLNQIYAPVVARRGSTPSDEGIKGRDQETLSARYSPFCKTAREGDRDAWERSAESASTRGRDEQDKGVSRERLDMLEVIVRRIALVVDTQGQLLRSLQVSLSLSLSLSLSIYIYIYIYIHTYMYIYVYIYIHIYE